MKSKKTFGLIIPIYNEENTLASVLDEVLSIDFVDQVVVANDGSSDGSQAILDAYLKRDHTKLAVVSHSVNQGKGAAIRSALKIIKTDLVGIQDADLEYDPKEYKLLLEPLQQNEAEVVFGSRFLRKNPNLYWTYKLGNKILTLFLNLIGGGSLTDTYTCFKAMPAETWKRLHLSSNGFEIEAEITIKILKHHISIMEIPIQYNPRTFEAGKKIRSGDAVKGMFTGLYYRFSSN